MKYSDTELAWAYLARVAEGPCAPLADLIAHVGPEYAAEVIRNKDVLPDALERKVRARREWDCAVDDLDSAHANGFRLLTPDQPEWPKEQLAVFNYDAVHARQEHDNAAYAPYALWVKGDIDVLQCAAVAVVGSRHPSTEGKQITTELSAEVAAEGVGIVSGLACGVDGIAHRLSLIHISEPTRPY